MKKDKEIASFYDPNANIVSNMFFVEKKINNYPKANLVGFWKIKTEQEIMGIDVETGYKLLKEDCNHDMVIKYGVAECQNCGMEEMKL